MSTNTSSTNSKGLKSFINLNISILIYTIDLKSINITYTLKLYILLPNFFIEPNFTVLSVGVDNYTFKFFVAILITPMIYLSHFAIDNYLGNKLAKKAKEIALKN